MLSLVAHNPFPKYSNDRNLFQNFNEFATVIPFPLSDAVFIRENNVNKVSVRSESGFSFHYFLVTLSHRFSELSTLRCALGTNVYFH